MKILSVLTVITLLLSSLSASALADPADIFNQKISRAKNLLVFPNKKGEVVFSHSRHFASLSHDQCILCHKVENPSLENIQSRFENHRLAHSFCKGCHTTIGRGPSECHQCHNYKKTS